MVDSGVALGNRITAIGPKTHYGRDGLKAPVLKVVRVWTDSQATENNNSHCLYKNL